MSWKRSFMRGQRARDNRTGGTALVMYRLEQQEKAKRERFKPYNLPKTIARAIARP